MQIRPFERADTDAVIELWQQAGLVRPWNDPRLDIERKLAVQPHLFLLGIDETSGDDDASTGGRVIASAMAGYDGHRGWINYLAVAPAAQGRGHGRTMMAEVERLLEAEGCPKVNLQIRADNEGAVAFYRALGYATDAVVSMGKRLITD